MFPPWWICIYFPFSLDLAGTVNDEYVSVFTFLCFSFSRAGHAINLTRDAELGNINAGFHIYTMTASCANWKKHVHTDIHMQTVIDAHTHAHRRAQTPSDTHKHTHAEKYQYIVRYNKHKLRLFWLTSFLDFFQYIAFYHECLLCPWLFPQLGISKDKGLLYCNILYIGYNLHYFSWGLGQTR